MEFMSIIRMLAWGHLKRHSDHSALTEGNYSGEVDGEPWSTKNEEYL